MQWKSLLMQGLVTFMAVFLGLRFSANTHNQHAERLETLQKSMAVELESIKNHLATMERTITGNRQGPSEVLNRISESLARLEAKLGAADRQKQSIGSFPPASASPPPLRQAMGTSPLGWMEGLSEQKRKQVDDIFRQQGITLRQKLPPPTQGAPPNPHALKEIMDENDQELREKLRLVLDDEEYRMFVESLPKPPNIGSADSPTPDQ